MKYIYNKILLVEIEVYKQPLYRALHKNVWLPIEAD